MLGGLFGGVYELHQRNSMGALIGGGALVAGYAAAGIGSGLQKPALPEDSAQEMAGRYDQWLRDRLGLPPLAPRSTPADRWSLRPGGGLAITGRF
jgi:hypothetical protein